MTGIYKIENLVNGKKYIGQSKNIECRWRREKNDAFNEHSSSYNYPLSRAFRKYGVENFSFEVIEECDVKNLNEKEKFWISRYDSFFSGYNQNLGGENGGVSKPKESIIGVFADLKNSDMLHEDIAKKWNVSVEMVQGINTGRHWRQDNIQYPIQDRCKVLQDKRGKGRTPRFCPQCGALISQKATLCIKCNAIASRKTDRPSREELKVLIRTTPFTQIAKQFGVSDNAIRKWCDRYNLPRKVTDIKNISDEEWLKI